MRLRIQHTTTYRYEPAATSVIQILRMTPGSHDGQYVAEWQIDVSTDSRLDVHQDAFGNVTHVLTFGALAELTVRVEGLIETHDTGGVPARFVSGHFLRSDGTVNQQAGHAWAEAFVPELGWVAFDAANGLCATEAHVRVAVGLDALSAAPLRGTRPGGAGEVISVKVRVDQAAQQIQN